MDVQDLPGEHRTVMLWEIALAAPLCAVHIIPDADGIMHAATMDALVRSSVHGDGTLESPCGETGLKLLSIGNQGEEPLPWPPRVAGLKPWTRCRTCQQMTGSKSPRSEKRPPLSRKDTD